jgi:Right handed beta helix region
VSHGRSLRYASQIALLIWSLWHSPSLTAQQAKTYYVDCDSHAQAGEGTQASPLATTAVVNALALHPGDRLLFKRGTLCQGELKPQGSGSATAPIRIGAYAEGPLPRIEATATDDASLRLFNQSYIEISSLDLKGGKTYGLFTGGDAESLRHIYLHDLRVHDVRGPLKHKESGLVVFRPTGEQISFDDIQLDGILAYNTTQWSGIFIFGASHVQIRNSTVHDVQGDGIVVFQSHDAVIEHSIVWHTGMQHQESIGTPNAIWTWRCTDCTVQENEAFLTDSPGIDGGAFDIDFGNTRNIVQRNFGHDTAGYCVSVFGAFGPTTASVVADNVCLNNGTSPRLAQRQGALLLMTWLGGSLNGVEIRDNRIDWVPPGVTPAVQTGDGLKATGVTLIANEIASSGLSFIDPKLLYKGERNRYVLTSGDPSDKAAALPAFDALPETGSTLALALSSADGTFSLPKTHTRGWRLAFEAGGVEDSVLRNTLVELRSAALQFGHGGLKVVIANDKSIVTLANDWSLLADGVSLQAQSTGKNSGYSLKLTSPAGKIVHEWNSCPSPADLGLELRKNVGPPDFSHLTLEDVRATD